MKHKALMLTTTVVVMVVAGGIYALQRTSVPTLPPQQIEVPLPPQSDTPTEEPKSEIEKKKDLIQVEQPVKDEIISSPLIVKGKARGTWFFEASFPLQLLDGNGKEIARGIAQAQGNWMTTDFVPFSAKLEFKQPATGSGRLVLEKDNPSGLPEHADSVSLPVIFSTEQSQKDVSVQKKSLGVCRPTGCSRNICSDKDLFTTCQYKKEYACYKTALCEKQTDGQCGWTQTEVLKQCIEQANFQSKNDEEIF